MPFMQMYIVQKGALYSADCSKCGATNYTHEWAYDDHNDRRDALESGTARCDHCCTGTVDSTTFTKCKRSYAGRYSADGFMDCTDWHYDTNRRRLETELRSLYGE